MSMKKVFVKLLPLFLPLALAACSGGGGSSSDNTSTTPTNPVTNPTTTTTQQATSVASLTVASQVSVVDPRLSGSVAAVAPLKIGFFSAMLAPSFPATSDYIKDKTNVYVQERSAEQFDTINNILCMMGQSKYDAMLNKGDYIALVDNNVCDSSSKSDASNSAQSSQQSQSSSANMPNYSKFTVNSSRADDNSPEYVKVWIHDNGKGQPGEAMLIYAYIKIVEGKSDTNPYGIFTMDFAGYPVAPNGIVASTPASKGTLRAVRSVPADVTSKVLLQFVSNDSRFEGQCGGLINSLTQVTLDRTPDGSGGAGHVKNAFSGGTCSGGANFNLAFDANDFFRQNLGNGDSVCLDRVHFKESAWSYGLYDATGTRVQRNSGFPISYTSGGKTYNGYIGYGGLWMDNSAPAITDGTVVNRMDYSNGQSTSTPYTVFASKGKLKKHSRKTMTLADIKNLPLGYFEQTMTSSGSTGTNYQVSWDGTNFNKIAQMPQNCTGNCSWSNLTAPYATIKVDHLPWGTLNFWSQNGGGQFQVPLSSCTYTNPPMVQGQPPQPGYTVCAAPTNALPVIYYAEDLVYPGDSTVPTTLTCYNNCPDVVNGQAVSTMNSGPSNTATTYSFDRSALMLKDSNGANVVSTTTNSLQQWGVQTGALFDKVILTQTNPDTGKPYLQCDWKNFQTNQYDVCGWKAQSELPAYYTWETGPNTYNQFIGIKDQTTGAIKKFDPPLKVKYVNAEGTTFMLDYSGFGQLNGIPGKCVNMDTGADADCSQGGSGNNSIRWVPQFTIPGLTSVSATDPAANTSTTCYVKPLAVEQRMLKDTAAGACSALALTNFSSYTLPGVALWIDPTTTLGTEPAVTAAPAVIGGVVQ